MKLVSDWLLRNTHINWLEVTGNLVSYCEKTKNDIVYPGYPCEKMRYPEVQYKYQHEGVDYQSNRVALYLNDIAILDKEISSPWSEWKEGKSISVFINPKTPSESVLLKYIASNRRFQYMQAILGAYFTVIGFFVLYWLLV